MATEAERLRDLVPEIPSRLPVKSLMRFQCINKSWYDLIKTPDFVSKHLHTFNKTSSSRVATNYNINGSRNQFALSLLSIDGENGKFERNDDFSLYTQISKFQCRRSCNFLNICGPCNGIYYLNRGLDRQNASMLINPSRREFRVLPNLPVEPFNEMVTLGFGFDQMTNDYKLVVWIRNERLVFVYSLNSNSWREALIPVPSFESISRHSYAVAHGAFPRWAQYSDGADVILAFDMAEEAFEKFKLPEEGRYWIVANFKETIAATTGYPSDLSMDFWIMKEYGNESSWFKCLKVGPIQEIGRFSGKLWDDNFLFPVQDCYTITVLYDHRRGEIKDPQILDLVSCFWKTSFYVESLVSLNV